MSVLDSIKSTNYPSDCDILTCGVYKLGDHFYKKAEDLEKLKITDSQTDEAIHENQLISRRQRLYKFLYVSSRIPIFGSVVLLIAKARSIQKKANQTLIVRNDISRYYPDEFLNAENTVELKITKRLCLLLHPENIEKDISLLSSEINRVGSLKSIFTTPDKLSDLNLETREVLTIVFYRAIYKEEMIMLKNAIEEHTTFSKNCCFIGLKEESEQILDESLDQNSYMQTYKKNEDDEYLLKEIVPDLSEKILEIYQAKLGS